MEINLKGKQIVITGGSRGIGKVIADHLGQCGASFVVISRTESELRRTEREFSKKGYLQKAFKGNVLNLVHIKKVISSFEKIDVLINCAGIQGEIGPLHQARLDKWKETFEINFYGTLNCISAVLPFMLRERKGKIINFSGGGANYSRPNFTAYGVSKSAIVRLTETLADELHAYNIQVNAVSPGAIQTKMISDILEAGPERAGEDYKRIKLKLKEGLDSPNLAAKLVCYLSADESSWITGKVISAVWDPWQDWMRKGQDSIDKDMYVLRRIDGRNFIKKT